MEETGPESKADGSDKSLTIELVPTLALFPSTSEAFAEIQAELSKQTDRGLAVLGVTYLEWRVVQTIQSRCFRWEAPPYRKQRKPQPIGAKLFGSDKSPGELGFLSKCRMAYCLGLVGPAGIRDMERIAEIRNKFAHHLEVRAFAGNERVKELCDDLESVRLHDKMIAEKTGCPVRLPEGDKVYRYLFLSTIQHLWISLFHVAAYCPLEWTDPATKLETFW